MALDSRTARDNNPRMMQTPGEVCSPAGITFRPFGDEADYDLLRALAHASALADGDNWAPTLDEIRTWCAPTARFDPVRQIVFALAPAGDGESLVVGACRVSWYTTRGGVRVYPQSSFLRPEWRRPGVWTALVQEGDRRIRALVAQHPDMLGCSYQGWASENQTQWIDAPKAEGYDAVRHFRNMVRPLTGIPAIGHAPLPSGVELRPASSETMRAIWSAQAEVNRELFEYVAERWDESRYPGWLADASHTPELWQVAWDGEELAGMVLPRIDREADPGREKRRGYTEHVFVRRPWRGRGLARALLVRSLHALHGAGMVEAELGVDSENESGAYSFYERLGYVTERTDIWFRKPLESS